MNIREADRVVEDVDPVLLEAAKAYGFDNYEEFLDFLTQVENAARSVA